MRILTACLLVSTCFAAGLSSASAAERPPNIVLILADDLGYGDVACFNPQSKVPTPHLDRLAGQGIRFTDAHSPATVCTPSRYSVMTGRMAFRTGFRGVFTGVDGPLIESGRLTLPAMLKQHGYATACVGKWHIGMTFLKEDGTPVRPRGGGVNKVRKVDWSRAIQDGPVNVGFDYFFGTVCCPTTDWLYAYIENDRVVEAPTKLVSPPQGNWLEYGYFRRGLIAPNFEMDKVDLVFLEKSVGWLEQRAREPDKPFFLFHNTQTAHLPSIPAEPFVGKTPVGPHGDFVFEFDHVVGELMATLDRLNLAENTLLVVTSDNGPEIVTGQLREQYGHNSSGPWRGFKRDNWEAGHRVPFIARWPGHVPAGATSKHVINLTDLMATCAAIVGADIPPDAAEDSRNILAELKGANAGSPGDHAVLHETMSLKLAIRRGPWKLLDHQGSGGNGYTGYLEPYALPETDPEAPAQLYNLADDPGERTNLYSKQPDIAARLRRELDAFVSEGRSVPAGR